MGLDFVIVQCNIDVGLGRNRMLETDPMIPFTLGVLAIALANLVTDHAARREGFDEFAGGVALGA